jgi:hypothetical protein
VTIGRFFTLQGCFFLLKVTVIKISLHQEIVDDTSKHPLEKKI